MHNLLSERLGVTVGVAEEFICNTLKKKDNFTDVLIERQRLYGFEVVVGSGIQCWQYQYQKPPLPFQPPPLESSTDPCQNHYVPPWAICKGNFKGAGGKVRLSDDKTDPDLAIQRTRKPLVHAPYSLGGPLVWGGHRPSSTEVLSMF